MLRREDASNLSLVCDLCGQKEKGKGYLERHFDRKHRKFHCNVCNQIYTQKCNLLNHVKSHFEKFVCSYCGAEISRFEQLQKHIYLKHEPHNKQLILSVQARESYDCRFCPRTFPTAIHRNSHEKNIHKSRTEAAFKCKECQLICITKEQLRSHSFEHYVGMLHICSFPDCDRFFKSSKQLRSHKQIHGPPKFKCDKCSKRFLQSSNMSKHRKICKGEVLETVEKLSKEDEEAIARIAKEQFYSLGGRLMKKPPKVKELKAMVKRARGRPRAVKNENPDDTQENVVEYLEEYLEEIEAEATFRHSRRSPKKIKPEHIVKDSPAFAQVFINEPIPVVRIEFPHQTSDFVCDVCGYQTSHHASLKLHLKTHQEEKILRCDDCGIKFTKKTEFNRHMRCVHSIINRRRRRVRTTLASCDVCGKTTLKIHEMRRHMKQHLEPKERCIVCNLKLRNLKKHMKEVHTTIRPFVCAVCGAGFKVRHNLTNHMKTHDEPTECQICHKFLPNIERHLLRHKRPRPMPLRCSQCDKTFATKQSLQSHQERIHERVPLGKIYKCSTCNLTFIRNRDLRQHSFIHYTGKIFTCNALNCNEMFKKAFKLMAHMMVHNTSNEASFACNICDKKYLRQTALNKHQRQAHSSLK